MAKSALLGGRTVKVENRSGFDKSNLHLLTSKVGTITPIRKQLVIPSSGKCRVTVHAELPPLAADAYIRSHVKLEAFYCPLRLCYGGFQSWFAEENILDPRTGEFTTAALPWGLIPAKIVGNHHDTESFADFISNTADAMHFFGPNSLSDYFGVHFNKDVTVLIPALSRASGNPRDEYYQGHGLYDAYGVYVNLFPYMVYSLIYHHYYRNKSVQTPCFSPEGYVSTTRGNFCVGYLPYVAFSKDSPAPRVIPFIDDGMETYDEVDVATLFDEVDFSLPKTLDGHNIFETRQRNWGDDYFASAKPTAQQTNPVTVQVDDEGKFTIASLRAQNALADFADVNRYATPDYVQACMARYGVAPSSGVVQKPVLLGSDDIPMFTKGVSQTAGSEDGIGGTSSNPFIRAGLIGASAGRASANGSGFDFTFDVKEPGYVMIMATLVPEANYASGISKDMRNFISDGSLMDLPCSLLENIGDEPIDKFEVNASSTPGVFGYVQRFLHHKIGEINQVSGLFRKGFSLQAFAPQRNITSWNSLIGSNFLKIDPTALDDVSAVDSLISQYGVMFDTYIEMFVNEPLSESALPSLVDPAREHGKSVYLKNGGSGLA